MTNYREKWLYQNHWDSTASMDRREGQQRHGRMGKKHRRAVKEGKQKKTGQVSRDGASGSAEKLQALQGEGRQA